MSNENAQAAEPIASPVAPDVGAQAHAPSHNLVGGLWILGAAFGFSIQGVLVKYLGDGYSPALQNFYRQWVGVLVVLPIILRLGKRAVATSQPGLVLYRGMAIMVAATLNLYSMQMLPLAQANALSFTRALWLVPMAILLLKEKVPPARIIAALVGFAGVLVMIRPDHGGAGFDLGPPVLAALASAFLFASTALSVRMSRGKTDPTVLFVWSSLLGAVFAIPGALVTWRTPDLHDGLVLLAMGVLTSAAQACFIRGSAIGEASVMASVDYSRIVFAAVGAYLAFGERPSAATIVGALIVIGATAAATWAPRRKTAPA